MDCFHECLAFARTDAAFAVKMPDYFCEKNSQKRVLGRGRSLVSGLGLGFTYACRINRTYAIFLIEVHRMTVASAYETTNEIAGNISGLSKQFEKVTLELLLVSTGTL